MLEPIPTNSIDFMSDSLIDGRPFRLFNVIDDFNRESLAIEADTSLPTLRVIRVLERQLIFALITGQNLSVTKFEETDGSISKLFHAEHVIKE